MVRQYATQRRYPSDVELAILTVLKEHHYLTVEQVMLVTGHRSVRAMQQRLKDLADAGLVAKHDRRSSQVTKPLRAAWSLTGKSRAYLQGAGMLVLLPRQVRPYTLDHQLAVNDVLIAAKVLSRDEPDTVTLRGLYHDRDLRTWQPPLPVVPDGFIDLVVQTPAGRESFPILLELDMATMAGRRWQEKVRRYVPFLRHALEAAFGTDVATIAVVVQDTDTRLGYLKRWTEQELARLDAADLAGLFYFTQLTPGVAAQEFFRTPRWLVAGTKNKESLLPGDILPSGTPPVYR